MTRLSDTPTVVRPTDLLIGSRVAVIGSGEVLARVLGQLHRLGAECVVLDDPYQAVAALTQRPGAYPAAVFVLPSIYPDELPAISAILKHSPGTRVVVAAAEQQVSSLAAALRLGASGVLTEHGIEAFAGQDAPPFSPTNSTPSTQPSTALPPENEESTLATADDAHHPTAHQPHDDHHSDYEPTDPILTADELHALLHDDVDGDTGH